MSSTFEPSDRQIIQSDSNRYTRVENYDISKRRNAAPLQEIDVDVTFRAKNNFVKNGRVRERTRVANGKLPFGLKVSRPQSIALLSGEISRTSVEYITNR